MSGNSDPKIKRPKLQQKLSQFFTKSDLGDKSEILSTNAQPLDSGSDHEYDNANIEVEKVEVETRSDDINTSDSDDNNDTSDDEVGRPSESDSKVERIESIQSSHRNYPSCWSLEQYNYFSSTYSWMECNNGLLGCTKCRNASQVGVPTSQNKHFSKEWVTSQVSPPNNGDKQVILKTLRKKISKHANSKSHKDAVELFQKKDKKTIQASISLSCTKSELLTEKCIRSAYYVAFYNRPYVDYQHLIQLQQTNGIDMGHILHGRTTCTSMINCIASTMRQSICQFLIKNNRKIGLILDESTSISKKSCLIIYIRALIDEKPENIFLDLCELENQDAISVKNALLTSLKKNGFTSEYLSNNLVSFTSDGASVMLGVKNGVGTQLKNDYHSIILWHCLNHRLELGVSDAIEEIGGFYPLQSLFYKLYSVYSTSPKLQRQLQNISEDLGMNIRKIGRVFTIRWVASSFRTVSALWHNYPALYEHFKQASVCTDMKQADRQQFKGLAEKLSTRNFVEDLALLKDCLGQLSILSETLQSKDMNILDANRHVKWTVNALVKIKQSMDKYRFSETTTKDPVFKGVKLHEYESRSGYVSFNKLQFMQAIIDNLSSRMITNKCGEDIIHDLSI